MKKLNKILLVTIAVIFSALCLSACRGNYYEVDLGGDLNPCKVKADSQGLTAVYTNDTDEADIYIYNYPKEDDSSLEEFGQKQAAEYNIFCNMLTADDEPTAVLNYYENVDGKDYIVQAYIYEGEKQFVKVCYMFKTEKTQLGSSDLSICMIKEYEAEKSDDSLFPDETVYVTENDRLPTLTVRQFGKDYFSADTFDADLLPDTAEAQFSAYAEDGWTLDEAVSLCSGEYDLLKGEVIERNGLDLAFIGYIDNGVFKTRAIIDDGDDYIMLCAEADAAKFQHVTNALIDSISKAD